MTPGTEDRWTLIFDGDCGFCHRSVAWVRERDRGERVEIVPYQDPDVPRRFPEIPPDRFPRAMQLVSPEGERWEGARAAEEILRLLPKWRWVAPFFRIPLVRPVADRVYRWVARNRGRLGCGDHCPLREE
jgi:predicted DCC family thiol-disulfide oxidoreductase YuxK